MAKKSVKGILGVLGLTAISGIASFMAGRVSDGQDIFPLKKEKESEDIPQEETSEPEVIEAEVVEENEEN